MVAYSFQKRFAPKILLGLKDPVAPGAKRQTIRAPRKRHARSLEFLQLYTGMRTKYCQKIGPDPVCTTVEKIRFEVLDTGIKDVAYGLMSPDYEPKDLDQFAVDDGFADARDMSDYWRKTHGDGLFEGALIKWLPWSYYKILHEAGGPI